MAIWPFRSRPTVVPFSDDPRGDVLQLYSGAMQSPLALSIPNNLYATPSSIVVSVTAANIGIRAVGSSIIEFRRGSSLFAFTTFAAIVDNVTRIWCMSSFGAIYAPAGQIYGLYLLPPGLRLYPDDQILFTFAGYNALDTINFIRLHGDTWEDW